MTPYIAEFGNSLSSLAVFANGAWGIWAHWGRVEPRFMVAFAAFLVVGLGSAASACGQTAPPPPGWQSGEEGWVVGWLGGWVDAPTACVGEVPTACGLRAAPPPPLTHPPLIASHAPPLWLPLALYVHVRRLGVGAWWLGG